MPHPTLVDPTRTADVVTEPGLVVLHLKSLRTNVVDPVAVVAAAAAGAARAGGRVEVDLHPGALDDPRLAGLAALVAASGPGLQVRVHDRFDHLDLERYLRRAHATVLPYRWGTHSGWLELARDLGTRVVAPSCGHYAEQWSDVVTYGYDEAHGLDAPSLAAAVGDALSRPAPLPPTARAGSPRRPRCARPTPGPTPGCWPPDVRTDRGRPAMSVPDPRVLHLVVGPDQHGVVRHGVQVAEACGHRTWRVPAPEPLPARLLDGVDVVHVPFTDRLFAARCEDAATAFETLVEPVRQRGVAVSVTLHDLPAGDDPLDVRRRAAYDRVVRRCAGVVVNSRRELELAGRLDEHARSLRLVPLPVDRVARPDRLPPARWSGAGDVVVLGFLFPDRGYEPVVDALPDGAGLLALGRPVRRARGPAGRVRRPGVGARSGDADQRLRRGRRPRGGAVGGRGARRAQPSRRRVGVHRDLGGPRPPPARAGHGVHARAGRALARRAPPLRPRRPRTPCGPRWPRPSPTRRRPGSRTPTSSGRGRARSPRPTAATSWAAGPTGPSRSGRGGSSCPATGGTCVPPRAAPAR